MKISEFTSLTKSYFLEGNERSILVKRNVFALFFIKGLQIAISFLLVPLTIKYVDTVNYGIWLTISSIIAWMNFFDIGLNNGLRNKFAEAKAKNNLELVRQYVSTTYFILGVISIIMLVCYFLIQDMVNWNNILRISESITGIGNVVMVVVIYFALKFILSTISIICIADQRPAYGNIINLSGDFLALIVIAILVRTTEGKLIYLSYGLCIPPVFAFLLFNILLFSRRYRTVRPSIKMIDFTLVKSLFNLGIMFFVIQIAMIIQFQTSNLIIIRYFGEADVTLYNITYKYFNVLVMILTIALTPIWSSVTDAYYSKDTQWIKTTLRKYNFLTFGLIGFGFLLLLISEFVFRIWIGKNIVNTNIILSFWVLMYVYSLMYGRIHVTILNGIGALRIQMIAAMVSPIIFLLFIYFLNKNLNIGLISIPIAGIIANFNGYLLAPMQYRKVFISKKKGIWIK